MKYTLEQTLTVRGHSVRAYRCEAGQLFVALCDVLPLTSYAATTEIVNRLSVRAQPCLTKPIGDIHRKWVARKDETFRKLGLTVEETCEDLVHPRTNRLDKAQAKLNERICKHDRDIAMLKARITNLEDRIKNQEKGRAFLSELLAEIS